MWHTDIVRFRDLIICKTGAAKFLRFVFSHPCRDETASRMGHPAWEYKGPEDITGENGLLNRLTKALVERALAAELTTHLGYEKHSVEGRHHSSKMRLNSDDSDPPSSFLTFAEKIATLASNRLKPAHFAGSPLS